MTSSFVKPIGTWILGTSVAVGLSGCCSTDKSADAGPPLQPAPPQLAADTAPPKPAPTPAPPPKPLTAEDAEMVSISATVKAIDVAKREMTLQGPSGHEVSFVVDQRVKRLDEIKVGDVVTADYFASVAGELRPATDAELKNPLTVLDTAARGPKGSADLSASTVRAFKAVCTVESLDLPRRSVTLKGPLGNEVDIRAKNVDNLKKLRLGDTIVVTYTEALAVSVEKAPRPAAKPE